MKVKTTPAKTVDEYLERVPDNMRDMLEKLRQTIRKAAPKAEEIISYQIPTYKYLGPLVHFAAFKDHCSFVVINKDILKTLEKELQLFKTTGTTIHFTPSSSTVAPITWSFGNGLPSPQYLILVTFEFLKTDA